MEKSNWKNGELHGNLEYFYENGQCWEKGKFKEGNKDGLHIDKEITEYKKELEKEAGSSKENFKNELQELVNEIDIMKKEVDANKDKILQFNELAKEMGYLEEEIGIKQKELYAVKQAIRELKKESK